MVSNIKMIIIIIVIAAVLTSHGFQLIFIMVVCVCECVWISRKYFSIFFFSEHLPSSLLGVFLPSIHKYTNIKDNWLSHNLQLCRLLYKFLLFYLPQR